MTAKVLLLSEWAKHIRKERAKTHYTWVIGAGFSASAGIPLAGEVTDILILFEYCCQENHRCWPQINANCGDVNYGDDLAPFLRWYHETQASDRKDLLEKSKAWFNSNPEFKGKDEKSPLTYSLLFQKVMHDPTLHHTFLTNLVQLARGVNLAHLCLAAFMLKKELSHTVFTTNFDDLMLKAVLMLGSAARIFGELDSQDAPWTSDVTYPQIVHLHGRHTGYKLANTEAQLKTDDKILKRAFAEHLANSHLIVVGYSGWDDTVMRALTEWPAHPNLLRGALYWVPYHGADSILPETRKFLDACPADKVFIIENEAKNLDADRFMLEFLKAHERDGDTPMFKWAQESILANAREQHQFILKELERYPEFAPPRVGDLLDAANMARAEGRLDEARGLFDRAVQMVKDEGQSKERGKVFLHKARFEMYVANLGKSRKDLAQALMFFQSEKDQTGEANVLEYLGDLELREDHLESARKSYTEALPLCRAIGDRLGEANVLQSMGELERREGHLEEARKRYDEALPLFRAIGDRLGEANVLRSLGNLELREDHLEEVRKRYNEALQLYRDIGERLGEANVLQSLGDLELHEDHLEEARKRYNEALQLYRDIGERLGEANVLRSLGDLERREGHLEEARKRYDEALPLFRAIGDRLGETNVLKSLGDLELREDHLEEARKRYDEALPLYRAIGSRLGEANALQSLGDLELRESHLEEARKSYAEALPLNRAIGDRLGEANTLFGLGWVRLKEEDEEAALLLFDQALAIYDSIPDHYSAARALRPKSWALDALGRKKEAEEARKLCAEEAELGDNRVVKGWLQEFAKEELAGKKNPKPKPKPATRPRADKKGAKKPPAAKTQAGKSARRPPAKRPKKG